MGKRNLQKMSYDATNAANLGSSNETVRSADFARIAGKNCIGFSWAIPLLLSMDQ
jgi:hypothetical protein